MKRILPYQPPNIPKISKCSVCGSSDTRLVDWDFCDRWAVHCYSRFQVNPECNTIHRAVSRWNRKQERISSIMETSNGKSC
jgi:hypothetical protein